MPRLLSRGRLATRVPAVLVLLLVAGCAAGPSRAPDPDVLRSRLPELEERAAAMPDRPEAQADYALALFVLKDAAAGAALARAHELDPSRSDVALALGTLKETRGDLAGAAEVYRGASAAGARGEDELRARLDRVEHDLVLTQMKALVSTERSLDVSTIPENTLAVVDFEAGVEDPALRPLGRALSSVLTTELSRLPGVRLIERQRIGVLQAELALAGGGQAPKPRPVLASAKETRGVQERLALLGPGPDAPPFYRGPVDGNPGPALTEAIRAFQAHAGIAVDGIVGPETRNAFLEAMEAKYLEAPSPVDPATAPRAGRLLGARRLLSGRYTQPVPERIEVRSRFLDVVTDSVVAAVDVESRLSECTSLPGRITVEVAEALGIPLEPGERRRLMELPPATRSLPAFLAFGRGLQLEELGLWDEAEVRYREALSLDPDFSLARDRASVVSVASASPTKAANDLASTAGISGPESSEAAGSGNPALTEAVGAIGTGIGGSGGDGEQGSIDRPDLSVGPVTGIARITIRLPRGAHR